MNIYKYNLNDKVLYRKNKKYRYNIYIVNNIINNYNRIKNNYDNIIKIDLNNKFLDIKYLIIKISRNILLY